MSISKTIGTIVVRLGLSLSLPLAVVDAVAVGGVGVSSIAIMSSIATIEKVRISISLGLGLSLPLAVVDAVAVAIAKTMAIKATIAKTIGTIEVRLSLSLRLGKSHGDQGKESNSFHLDVSPTKE